jgi:hypothetical protein
MGLFGKHDGLGRRINASHQNSCAPHRVKPLKEEGWGQTFGWKRKGRVRTRAQPHAFAQGFKGVLDLKGQLTAHSKQTNKQTNQP